MKKIDENKLYYLKKNKLLFSSKQIGSVAKFKQYGDTIQGKWIEDIDSDIICMRHEFFKIFKSMKNLNEKNVLRINNFEDFIKSYTPTYRYKSHFKILSELEDEIRKREYSFNTTILIPYREEAHIIFRLVDVYTYESYFIVNYEYETSCS